MDRPDAASLCHACLSCDRMVSALATLRPTYDTLMRGFACATEEVRLCWECAAVLAKAEEFRSRVMRGRIVLESFRTINEQSSKKTTYHLLPFSQLMKSSKNSYDFTFEHIYDTTFPCKEEIEFKTERNDTSDDDIPVDVQDDFKFTYPFTPDESKEFDGRASISEEYALTNVITPKLEEDIKLSVSKLKRDKTRKSSRKRKARTKVKKMKEIEAKTEWRCRVCEQNFVTRGKMTYHQRTVHADPVLCNECGRVFSFKPTLEKHMLTHFGGVPQFPCAVCGKSFAGRAGIKSHMLHVHATGAESFRCEPCDLSFKTKYKYRTHLKWSKGHGGEGTEKHECDKCHRRYKTKQRLFEHYSYQHLGKAAHKCNICSKEISSLLGLQKHTRFVHEGREQPRTHVCETCGDAFKQVSMLRQHQYIHTGEKPFACDECGATFRQKGSLYKHRHLVHLNPKNPSSRTEKVTHLLAS